MHSVTKHRFVFKRLQEQSTLRWTVATILTLLNYSVIKSIIDTKESSAQSTGKSISPETRFEELGIPCVSGSVSCKPAANERKLKHINPPSLTPSSSNLSLVKAGTHRNKGQAQNLVDNLKPPLSALTFSKPPVIESLVLGEEAIHIRPSDPAFIKIQSQQSSMNASGNNFEENESKLTFVQLKDGHLLSIFNQPRLYFTLSMEFLLIEIIYLFLLNSP